MALSVLWGQENIKGDRSDLELNVSYSADNRCLSHYDLYRLIKIKNRQSKTGGLLIYFLFTVPY